MNNQEQIEREREKMERRLVEMCIEAATQSRESVDTWRKQRRSLERMPSQLADDLLRRLLRRRLLYPSLLEVFKHSVEEIDLTGENRVDMEWMAYIGAFRYLRSLNVADCHRINNSALWSIIGMINLKEVDLSRCSKVTDAGIRHLLSIPTLEKLCISQTGVTADGVTLLSSLTNLSVLDLGGLCITDRVLSSLQALTKLQYLDLWGSEISDTGAALLKMFPNLSFLNLALTKVSNLPNLPSLACLNMSNCTIHSVFDVVGDKAPLTKLILSGATFPDVSEALLNVETSLLSFLDLSNSSLITFCFLPYMTALNYLDLSGSSMGDDGVEQIACIGENLRYLNLNKTRVSSAGVGILAGHVPNLETISLSSTATDDLAISHISMMPALKVINLCSTNIKGLIHQEEAAEAELNCVPSLTALRILNCLERLDLDETQIRDEALCPLSSFRRLTHLSLKSVFLTDTSLYHLSSIQTMINLSIGDAVLTNTGLDSFNPPTTLRVLDLRGCWLLTEDALLLFCKKYPNIEVRHELVPSLPSDIHGSNNSSPSRLTSKTLKSKQKLGKQRISTLRSVKDIFIDQRLKYSRQELLALQFSSTSLAPPYD